MYENLEALEHYAAMATLGLALYASGKKSDVVERGLENGRMFLGLAAETPGLEELAGAQEYLAFKGRLEESLRWMQLAPSQFTPGAIKRVRNYFSDWVEMIQEAKKTEKLDALPDDLYTQETEVVQYQSINF